MIDSLCGIQLPVSGKTEVREAFSTVERADATLFVGTKVQPNSRAYEWNLITAVENYSPSADTCSFYFKADNYSTGHIFGGVIEVRDVKHGQGAMWGLEVDLFTHATDYSPTRNPRYGVGIVIGRQNAALPKPAYIDQAFTILPWQWKQEEARVGYGYRCAVRAEKAAFSMLAGDAISFDDGGEIGQRFDPATGYMEWCFRGKPVMQLQMETGALLVNGKQIN